jgi:regulator of cell morphogenesis and NO signaling
MELQQHKTVREIVATNPGAARIFEKFGIDYCCGGGKPFAEACSSAKVSVAEVTAALEKPQPTTGECDWQKAELAELIGHIVVKHHGYTREELARLRPLMAKVAGAHGMNHPELEKIQVLLQGLAEEMTMHMMKEEHMLFPYIEQLENAVKKGARPAPPMFGTVRNPVRMMMMEHDSAGDAVHEMRRLSHGFQVPEDACMSFHALYQGLQEFEADLHQHVHLENNILFPRAVEMEAQAA